MHSLSHMEHLTRTAC